MPIRACPGMRRLLQSELLLVVAGLGFSFLLVPDLFSNPAYAPLRVFPSSVWAAIFLGVSVFGFVGLYRGNARLWKIFCISAVFLLVWMAVARAQGGQITATVTYSALAWSAILRSIGVPSATFVNARRKQL